MCRVINESSVWCHCDTKVNILSFKSWIEKFSDSNFVIQPVDLLNVSLHHGERAVVALLACAMWPYFSVNGNM